ncbi:hypothetical protein WJX74_004343 [Apatococcus lobatus]|uniref:Ribosomal RNA-processing protein 42 n=2 Tax=Apatococcus TaxID=904362 RepID=A0AAW1SVA9_9CHLO
MISRYERLYTAEGAKQGLRADGRNCDTFRPVSCSTGVFEQCSGSARLRIGGTHVVATVKVELGAPTPATPQYGRLSFAVDYSPCSAATAQGRRGEDQSSELARALEQSIRPSQSGKGGALDLQSLCVLPGKTCWVLHVDGLILNADGSVLDALSLAIKAALGDTSIPLASVVAAEDPADQPEIDIDPDPSKYTRLDIQRIPVTLSIGLIGGLPVVDLTEHEELCADSMLHVSVNERGRICGITQRATSGINPATLQEMLAMAQRAAPKLLQSVQRASSQMETA